jgi:cytochrome bd ubiquinol oxidase subunit I
VVTAVPHAALLDHLLAGRAQMGTSLGFHIVFSSFGVGLPLLMLIAEGIALRTGDPVWRALARKWSKAFGILFAVGAVSGTIISFELGLLWPVFMRYAGGIVGLPFSLEGFAFFIEAIFLGIYLYGWDRLPPGRHLLAGIPVALAGPFSGFFIMTTNSWMNTPAGFDQEAARRGEIRDVDPVAAMFNESWAPHSAHMLIAAFMATAFAVAAVYAWGMLRGRRDAYHRRALALALAFGAVLAPVQIGVGDIQARKVGETQPQKLAAFEGLWETEKGVGLNLAGIPLNGEERTVLNVRIPRLLSVLAYDDPNAEVRGLKSFPKDERPSDPFLVRMAWLAMVGIGFFLAGLSVWVWVFRRVRGRLPDNRPTLWAVVAVGLLTFVALEAGWIVTEVGRQPWTIWEVVRTDDAVTSSPGLDLTFTGFLLLYLLLSVLTVWLLRRQATGAPPELAEREEDAGP